MKRITKWIQERKAYSNPMFGAMLIVSATIFPVFQASARIAEPVQPMALNADQVVDALNAVDAGITVEQAFMEQPLPYREWVKSQTTIYEALFQAPYTLADSDYFLFSPISLDDERTTVQGHNVHGEIFDLELTVMVGIENIHEDIPDDIADFLTSVNADDYAFTGTISTPSASFHVSGSIFQADLPDGTRNSFLLIGTTVDSSVIDFLNDPARDAPSFLTEGPEPQNCEQAFAIADSEYSSAYEIALENYRSCLEIAERSLRNKLIVCGVAVGVALYTGLGSLVAAAGGGTCVLGALADYDSALLACFVTYRAAIAAARITRTAAKNAAVIVFGSENCPGGPH